jgi:hypothetical protein
VVVVVGDEDEVSKCGMERMRDNTS